MIPQNINEMNLTLRTKDVILDCLRGDAEKLKRELEFSILKECQDFTIHIKDFINKRIEEIK